MKSSTPDFFGWRSRTPTGPTEPLRRWSWSSRSSSTTTFPPLEMAATVELVKFFIVPPAGPPAPGTLERSRAATFI